jgi:hypothetical protein
MAASSDRSLKAIATSNDKLDSVRAEILGVKITHKWGGAEAVTTALTPIASAKVYRTPVAAVALELVSTDNTEDIADGAGALTIDVIGIQDWAVGEVTSTITLTGTTPVAAGSWLRVYRMKVATSGVYAEPDVPSHDSTITLRVASAGETWATIGLAGTNFGASQTEIASYAIGDDKEVYINDIDIFVEGATTADVFLFVREDADAAEAPFGVLQLKESFRKIDGSTNLAFPYPLGPYTGPCDIVFMGNSTAATADIEIRFTVIEKTL